MNGIDLTNYTQIKLKRKKKYKFNIKKTFIILLVISVFFLTKELYKQYFEYKKASVKLEEFKITEKEILQSSKDILDVDFEETKPQEVKLHIPEEELKYINKKDNEEIKNGTYVVQKGDSLWSISKKFSIPMLKLAKINGLNPSGVLKIGQILRLDGTYEAKDENSERLAKTENILNSKQSQKIFFEKKYKIKKGDSLWSIACKFGIYVSTLEYINNTTSPVLKVGSYIKVSNVNYRPWIVKTTQKTKEFIKFFNITYDEFVKLNPKMKDKVEKGSKVYIPNKNPFWVKKIKVKTLNGGLLYWPTKGIIASPFGWRTHPIYKKRMFHNGIDIENKKNTKIVAVASGKVIFASYKGNSGKLVIILHRNGYQSIYAHLGKIKVKKGQWIKRGDLVGLMGDTGVSTGTHLHFGIRRYGKFLDPMDFLN